MVPPPSRISFIPANIATQGQPLDICYDFDGLPDTITEVKLKLKWTGATGPGEITVTRALGCAGLTVPDTALHLLVEDPSGNSRDNAIAVQEP